MTAYRRPVEKEKEEWERKHMAFLLRFCFAHGKHNVVDEEIGMENELIGAVQSHYANWIYLFRSVWNAS